MAKIDLAGRRKATGLLQGRAKDAIGISLVDWPLLRAMLEGWANKAPVFRWFPGVCRSRYCGGCQVGGI